MRLTSLGSGSSGNAFVLETATTTLLLDCGVAVRTLRSAIRDMGLAGRIGAVLVSHEHIDHIRSLATIQKLVACPVYATQGTLDAIGREHGWQPVQTGSRISVDDVSVTLVGVSHNAVEPCGFYVESNGWRAALFTDLGVPSQQVADAVNESDIVVLEANYDPSMLRHSPYPARLKQRIRGSHGHLSNDDCATLLAESVSERTASVWLAHLSETNNSPEVAVSEVEQVLGPRGIPVQALPRYGRVELRTPDQPVTHQPKLL